MKRKRQYTRQYKANMYLEVKARSDYKCVVCGNPGEQIHHVYKGKNKHVSDEHLEFMVYICQKCHQGTNGVHGKNGHELDERLKWEAQQRYEANGHTREEFISLIGRSYEP